MIRKDQSGFTLLETLVAFTILILVLGSAFLVFSQGAQTIRLAQEYDEASGIARNLLTSATKIPTPSSGLIDKKYQWEITRSEYTSPDTSAYATKHNYHSEKLVVKVSWTSARKLREVTLETLTLDSNEK